MEEFLFFSRPTLKQFYFIKILRDVLNLYWCRNVFVHVVWTYGNLVWSVKVLIQSCSLSVTLCLSSSVQSVFIRRIGVSIEANISDIRPTRERKNGLHWSSNCGWTGSRQTLETFARRDGSISVGRHVLTTHFQIPELFFIIGYKETWNTNLRNIHTTSHRKAESN